jgi:DNA-binding MarR family transcriptional regulator
LDPSAVEAFLHLMRTSNDLSEAFAQLHASHNISQGRFGVLMLLNQDPQNPVNPADLADRANVARATMTGLVDTLERDGFVKREHAPDDRRMMLVRLTPAGTSFIDKVLPDHLRRIAAVMAGTSVAERRMLVNLLAKIHGAVPAITR